MIDVVNRVNTSDSFTSIVATKELTNTIQKDVVINYMTHVAEREHHSDFNRVRYGEKVLSALIRDTHQEFDERVEVFIYLF